MILSSIDELSRKPTTSVVGSSLNGQFYIGQHKKKCFDKSYYGSGVVIQRALKKYGKVNFTVEILDWASSKKSLDEMETMYITENISDEKCINLTTTGVHGNQKSIGNAGKKCITDGSMNKYISEEEPLPAGFVYGNCNKGKVAINDGNETRFVNPHSVPSGWSLGQSVDRKNNPNYKKSFTAERRGKIRERFTGVSNPNYGKGCFGQSNGRYGKPMDEVSKKLSRISRSKYIFTYCGKDYYGIVSLYKQLRLEGIAISQSGIIGILSDSKKVSKKYPNLVGKISRRLKDEDKEN